MTIDALMTEIKKDLPFYDQSEGGITCSGGEPLSQPESLLALLRACGALGIHRAVDTSGFAPTNILLQVSQHTDLFLFDLKHMDSRQHQYLTGIANELILHNLQILSGTGVPIRVRIPLIYGVNSDKENIQATGVLAAQYKTVEGIDVLPYHPSASGKYQKLDMTNRGKKMVAPDKNQITKIVEILRDYKSDVRTGG
jgi:pyruvate formate lyase activating enzyme